jgi:hypothetical protein
MRITFLHEECETILPGVFALVAGVSTCIIDATGSSIFVSF